MYWYLFKGKFKVSEILLPIERIIKITAVDFKRIVSVKNAILLKIMCSGKLFLGSTVFEIHIWHLTFSKMAALAEPPQQRNFGFSGSGNARNRLCVSSYSSNKNFSMTHFSIQNNNIVKYNRNLSLKWSLSQNRCALNEIRNNT